MSPYSRGLCRGSHGVSFFTLSPYFLSRDLSRNFAEVALIQLVFFKYHCKDQNQPSAITIYLFSLEVFTIIGSQRYQIALLFFWYS